MQVTYEESGPRIHGKGVGKAGKTREEAKQGWSFCKVSALELVQLQGNRYGFSKFGPVCSSHTT